MVRTPSCDKSGLKKGTWTPEEDRKLIAYVTRYGCWNWRQLPKYAGLARCGKSCRLRWLNYLRPNIKRGNYTPEEEETIIKLHQKLGNRWSAIAAQLPGRTDNDIKNHWHTNLKKRFHHNSGTQENTQVPQVDESKQSEPIHNTAPSSDQTAEYSCPLSPQSSSSEFSSITTDATPANSNEFNLVVEDDEFAFLEAYTTAHGNFWTDPDPYVADIFCDPTDEIVSLPPFVTQSEYSSPSPDALLWTHNNMYDHYSGLF